MADFWIDSIVTTYSVGFSTDSCSEYWNFGSRSFRKDLTEDTVTQDFEEAYDAFLSVNSELLRDVEELKALNHVLSGTAGLTITTRAYATSSNGDEAEDIQDDVLLEKEIYFEKNTDFIITFTPEGDEQKKYYYDNVEFCEGEEDAFKYHKFDKASYEFDFCVGENQEIPENPEDYYFLEGVFNLDQVTEIYTSRQDSEPRTEVANCKSKTGTTYVKKQ